MRIAVANWSRRKVGGAESYLDTVIPALADAGCDVGLVCEVDTPPDRDPIRVPAGGPIWCLAKQGAGAIDEVRAWKPDLVFAHAFSDPAFGTILVEGRKGVFYVHDYVGSCITGTKTHSFPSIKPCTRRFGAGCLGLFYPRRCGGLNPTLGWRLYLHQKDRLAMLRQYSVIATASEYMRREFISQGFDRNRVTTVSSIIEDAEGEDRPTDYELEAVARRKFKAERITLLFMGRMVALKGGEYLLQALPLVAHTLRRPVDLIMAGEGPARSEWTRRAEALQRRFNQIRVEFRGWRSNGDLVRLARESHLLVMPSLWPEPFGRSGVEVARWGLPTVAFGVGGIPEWLHDGVNGHLAGGEPAGPSSLADAITRALADEGHYAGLCLEARRRTAAFGVKRHIECLSGLFHEVLTA